MATKRKSPFGYQLENGAMCCKEAEAKTVVWIYEQYAAGASYKNLTDRLNRMDIRYDTGKVWNKNMIARILADTRYTGGQYPQIIPAELSYQAKKQVQNNALHCMVRDEDLIALGRICYCGECGEKILRRPNYGYWICAAYQAGHAKITGESILSSVTATIKQLSESPNRITTQKRSDDTSEQAIMRMENELEREMDKPDCDDEAVKALTMRIAAEKYKSIGNSQYETLRLRELFSALPDSNFPLKQILLTAVERITVYPDGGIAITIKNGQTVNSK